MKKEHVILATFNDVEQARSLSNMLSALGVPAKVLDESKLQKFWFFSKPLACARVCVKPEDAWEAHRVLRQPGAWKHVLEGEVSCPMCGSPEIEYPQFTRKFVTTSVVAILCLLRMMEKRFYCTHCHHTWSGREQLREETDVLGFPRHGGRLVRRETL